MKQNKLFNFFAYLSILLGAGFMFLILFWCIYPYKTITFNDIEFPVNKTQVKQGEPIIYTGDYCKYLNDAAIVTRSYINQLIYVTPSTITNRETGCHIINIQTIIPKELPASTYYIQMTYQYQVNPIRKITVTHNTEEFEVVE